MEDHQENAARRNAMLDQGYNALQDENWQQADEIFIALLKEDPHCGMSCLGRAMAEKKIHDREELAESWEQLREDPDFLRALQPAKPDFLPWLQQDMEEAREDEQEGAEAAEAADMEDSDFSVSMPDFSDMSPGRVILLSFAGIQVLLFLLVVFFFSRSEPHPESPGAAFLADLILAFIVSGLPVIFGPVYGNSIVEAGRFCRILRIINNVVAIFGCVFSGIMVAAFYETLQESAAGARSDRYFCYVFIASFCIHALSFLVPVILDWVDYS